MRRIGSAIAIALFSSVAVATGSGLPSEVADRLENVIAFDEAEDFVGSYRITLSTLVQKPNGKSREESLLEADVIKNGEGETRRLRKYIEDGTDVTEKKREKFEAGNGGGEDDDDDDLADPFGNEADRYSFGSVEPRGSMRVIAFEPAPGHEDDDDIARGTIAWDAGSLEPRWLEMEAVHPPKPLKELRMRMEFQQIEDALFLSRLVTDGLAKILLFKREFHMEIRFDNIRLAAESAESAD
jgi:hypothetical protein